MTPRRPTVVVVVAVLNVVAGLLALLQGGVVLHYCVATLKPHAGTASPIGHFLREMERQIPLWFRLEVGKAVLVFGLGLVFLVGAVGLLWMSARARRGVIFGALVAVPLHLSYFVWQIGWAMPAATRALTAPRWADDLRRYPPGPPMPVPEKPLNPNVVADAAALGVLATALLFSGHGILVVFLLAGQRVRAAFKDEWESEHPPNAYRPALDAPLDLPMYPAAPGREG